MLNYGFLYGLQASLVSCSSILTRTKEFKMYNTVEERRAAERDQELRDSIDADVKEALKDLP